MSSMDLNEDFYQQGALFTLGNWVHIFWGHFSRSSERSNGPALYTPDFFLESTEPWIQFQHHHKVSRLDAISLLKPAQKAAQLKINWSKESLEMEDSRFLQQFQWTQKAIAAGQLQKAVPFREFMFSPQGSRLELIQNCLFTVLPTTQPYVYGFWNDDDFILGATPELLFQQKQKNQLETMALAGTTSWEDYQSEPARFEQNEKEIREHEFVVEFIRQQLQVLGELSVGTRCVVKAGQLAHFQTPIHLESKTSTNFEQLIHALHPTPALGCYPQKNWQAILKDMGQGFRRQRFGAPFALSLSADEVCVAVAIRNIEKVGETYRMLVGCGVVEESLFLGECHELQNKKKSTTKLLGL